MMNAQWKLDYNCAVAEDTLPGYDFDSNGCFGKRKPQTPQVRIRYQSE